MNAERWIKVRIRAFIAIILLYSMISVPFTCHYEGTNPLIVIPFCLGACGDIALAVVVLFFIIFMINKFFTWLFTD